MIQIRKGCFETNSSSTHAIIVSTEKSESLWNEACFDIGNFGWEFRVLSSIDEKASYFYTAACAIYEEDIFDKICEMLTPYGIKCYSKNRADFGMRKIYNGEEIIYLKNGGIDHNDNDEFVHYLMDNPENLISYLFDGKSYVVTGNDNCDEIDSEWFDKKVGKADSYNHKTFYKGN